MHEEAKSWMLKALEPMGEEYLNVVKEGLDNRWVDVYENKGNVQRIFIRWTFN